MLDSISIYEWWERKGRKALKMKGCVLAGVAVCVVSERAEA
jgi:hypothetical protein